LPIEDELGEGNPEFDQWVIQFSTERLPKGKAGTLPKAKKGFSKEIFKDKLQPTW